MYKVFFNDSFLQVCTAPPTEKNREVKPFTTPTQMDEWINCARESSNPIHWTLVTEHPQQAWQQLIAHLPIIEAAGGLVRNADGKYLFIYRRKRWDLPKGKMDEGETPEQAALREVEEETSLTPLKISGFLTHTFHIYWLRDHFTLKRTHWYLMDYNGNKAPVPQTIEDIERAEWMNLEEFSQLQEPVFGTVLEVVRSVTAK